MNLASLNSGSTFKLKMLYVLSRSFQPLACNALRRKRV